MSRAPPPNSKAEAAAALTPVARELHLAVLKSFAASGAPPSRAQLERFPVENRKALSTAFAELVDRDLVAVDDHGEIRAAYPFSARPTAILVQPSQGPAVHACCAIDALGMSAMSGPVRDHPGFRPTHRRRIRRLYASAGRLTAW
ncbi:hypothetical protein F0U47_00705 [Nocardioides antri]|uniref:Uncharacterized protein n=1 Tax=Nocardioides antri TaxID=2607659 RepID=A0A5B1M655_9ACTN|nr:hypothetical protein F0U47_00705 [Nocardioides antri]